MSGIRYIARIIKILYFIHFQVFADTVPKCGKRSQMCLTVSLSLPSLMIRYSVAMEVGDCFMYRPFLIQSFDRFRRTFNRSYGIL